jgi:hypothetical protein
MKYRNAISVYELIANKLSQLSRKEHYSKSGSTILYNFRSGEKSIA